MYASVMILMGQVDDRRAIAGMSLSPYNIHVGVALLEGLQVGFSPIVAYNTLH